MQIQSYQQKMLDYVEKYELEDLNWKQSEIEASSYERFFESDDDLQTQDDSARRVILWILNVVVYILLFRFFFGQASMVAFILPVIPLGIVALVVYICKIH